MRALHVLLLVLGLTAAACAIPADKPMPHKTVDRIEQRSIAEIVAASPQFKMLAAALVAAGLSQELNRPGSQTLFAPTDAAFAKLPSGRIEQLMLPQNRDQLTRLLRYHLMPHAVEAMQLVKLKFAPTINGNPLTVAIDGKQAMVDNAHIVKADILASNGVIHAIDTVLMPDDK